MAANLLERVRNRLNKEATEKELDTGRRKNVSSWEQYHERVGESKGLRRALEIVMEEAKAINVEEDGG